MIIDDLHLVRRDPSLINSVERVTEEMLNIAGINYLDEIRYAASEQVQIDLVRKHPILLAFIKGASEKVCIAALEQDGLALKWIGLNKATGLHQTRLMQATAVEQNPYALVYAFSKTVSSEVVEKATRLTNDVVTGFINTTFAKYEGEYPPNFGMFLNCISTTSTLLLEKNNVKISTTFLKDLILRNIVEIKF